jgi:hypothetical protein
MSVILHSSTALFLRGTVSHQVRLNRTFRQATSGFHWTRLSCSYQWTHVDGTPFRHCLLPLACIVSCSALSPGPSLADASVRQRAVGGILIRQTATLVTSAASLLSSTDLTDNSLRRAERDAAFAPFDAALPAAGPPLADLGRASPSGPFLVPTSAWVCSGFGRCTDVVRSSHPFSDLDVWKGVLNVTL